KSGISVETYWDIPADFNHAETRKAASEADQQMSNNKNHLRVLLEDAVKRRLISDVPLGAFLSGGVDSSIIVALMAKYSSRPVKTFSIGYKDLPSFDETKYAREVARLNNTDHQEFKLGYRDILDVFPAVLENLDEPFADSSAVPAFILSRETKNHVTVALSGDGGDELFAGYRMYLGEYWSQYYSKIPILLRNGLIRPFIAALPDARDTPGLEMIRRIKKFVRGMSLDFSERFCGWREIFSFSIRQELLTNPWKDNLYLNLIHEKAEKMRGHFEGDTINLMLYLDVKGLLHGDMLTKVDRMSMANSLEVRVPFLDHTFVEYAIRLKGNTKLKGKRGKFILLETFKDLLPDSIHRRPKWGFEMPIGVWLRNDLRFLIDEYLSEYLIKRQDLFNFKIIRDLINRHMNGRQDTSWQLWNLIVFQHWYKTYLSS
ncbi:MAG: asparagine synthase C-terminal domain-containing protein, partial [Thermodesulfobacteriota bacterium]|nr:asparagine synthase C-terminal domain-containing protein [Thermodesulfobacteriota bacterium]